jgi:hypothetical protein
VAEQDVAVWRYGAEPTAPIDSRTAVITLIPWINPYGL